MAKEFGTTEYENGRYVNGGAPQDNPASKPNPAPEEYHDYSAQSEEARGKRKKSTLLRSLSAFAVAAVAAVTVLPILPSLTRKQAEAQIELSATDGVHEYVVSLEDWEENDVSVLVLTAVGYVLSEQPAEQESVSGSVDGLKPGYRYEVEVKSIAGVFIVFESEYQAGDIIVVDGWRGTVEEIGILSTRIVEQKELSKGLEDEEN